MSDIPMRINWPAVIATIIPHIGGWVGGYFVRKNIHWYESLKKPSWTPPNWIFAPAWTVLYSTMGYSSYLVWKDGGGFQGAVLPLSKYAVNIAINWGWILQFFISHNIELALYEAAALCVSTATVGNAFYKVNPVAGYLFVPYLVWSTFATVLNYYIYRDNKQLSDETKKIKDVKFIDG